MWCTIIIEQTFDYFKWNLFYFANMSRCQDRIHTRDTLLKIAYARGKEAYVIYSNVEQKYEDIGCVCLTMPGAMGDDCSAVVVSYGRHVPRWRRYDLDNDVDRDAFTAAFPPFAEYGWSLAYEEDPLLDWELICLSSGQSLLVRQSIAHHIKRYDRVCETRQRLARDPKFRHYNNPRQSLLFNWEVAIDFLMTVTRPPHGRK